MQLRNLVGFSDSIFLPSEVYGSITLREVQSPTECWRLDEKVRALREEQSYELERLVRCRYGNLE